MKEDFYDSSKVKEKYLRFIKSQEVSGELFKDKITFSRFNSCNPFLNTFFWKPI